MRQTAWSAIALGFGIAFCCSLAGAEDPAPGKQVEQRFEYAASPRQSMGYLLYLPTKYTSETEKSPLILFLHGSGERGSSLQQVKRHGPPRLVEERSDLPFIVVSPQLSADFRLFSPAALAALLDDVVAKYRVDTDRIYVTGLSMGGGGTWHLAALQPDRFAAIAPICGWTDARDGVKLKRLPIWAIHGDDDGAVPYMETQQMVDALRDAGGDVKFTVFRGGGHDTWTAIYGMPEFYDWLLRHKRSDRK
jgi:predicted peptidase